jgi:hypothetical protein
VENRAIAKAEIIRPIAVLFTPNDFANTGMAGKIIPKPIETR